jgi:hypothetical protein
MPQSDDPLLLIAIRFKAAGEEDLSAAGCRTAWSVEIHR